MKEDKPKPVRTMQVNSERRVIVKSPIELVEWQFEALYRLPDPTFAKGQERYSEGQGDPHEPAPVPRDKG